MMNPIIEIRELGKKYNMVEAQPYLALRDIISDTIGNPFQKSRGKQDFWALRNINFNVQPGERIGVIGRNGAGKSTLLKILSRITPPTVGQALLNGRVASLLEVGTGFHPELTGRENIFFNGSVLGMKRKEIEEKYQKIVEFSGVEQFIDTPLKNYSTGMQLRLAFSVAAHLEPEILLIDEVLAVGDMEFQKKCIGKMEEVSRSGGRTLLFVSHNLTHIRQICTRAIWLDNGEVKMIGGVEEVCGAYTQLMRSDTRNEWKTLQIDQPSMIVEASIHSRNSENGSGIIKAGDGSVIELELHSEERIENSVVAIRFTNHEMLPVFTTTNADETMTRQSISAGKHRYRIPIPSHLLIPGSYTLEIAWIVPYVKIIHKVPYNLEIGIRNDQYAGEVLRDGRAGLINHQIRWEKTQ